jgi:hypothetical protein
MAYSSAVDDVGTLCTLTVAGCRTVRDRPGTRDRLPEAMRRRAEVCTQVGGRYMEHLL